MKFSKIGKHTIRCVISEQEIQDLGYTIEEIMSNGERTQEFMNQIFDMAEQSFETKFELGIKTVRADFMSDHTLALTFSEHPGSDEMMEHLKDIVNGLMNAIPQQKWAQINEARQNEGNPDQVPVYATIVFADFDRLLLNFCRSLLRCHNAPHLIERIHVKRQRIQLSLIIRYRTVRKTIELRKTRNIIPHFFIICMENVRTVFVHMDILNILRINVACNVRVLVDHKHFLTGIRCLSGKYRTE